MEVREGRRGNGAESSGGICGGLVPSGVPL
mgnify:FL=1